MKSHSLKWTFKSICLRIKPRLWAFLAFLGRRVPPCRPMESSRPGQALGVGSVSTALRSPTQGPCSLFLLREHQQIPPCASIQAGTGVHPAAWSQDTSWRRLLNDLLTWLLHFPTVRPPTPSLGWGVRESLSPLPSPRGNKSHLCPRVMSWPLSDLFATPCLYIISLNCLHASWEAISDISLMLQLRILDSDTGE